MARTIEEAFVAIRPDSRRFLPELESQLRSALQAVERDLKFSPQLDAAALEKGGEALGDIEEAGSKAADSLKDIGEVGSDVSESIQDIGDAGGAAIGGIADLADEAAGLGAGLEGLAGAGGDAGGSVAVVGESAGEAAAEVAVYSGAVRDAFDRLLTFARRNGLASDALGKMTVQSGVAAQALSRIGGGAAVGAAAVGAVVVGVRSVITLTDEIRRFSQLSGAGAEDASRFVAALDDLAIPAQTGANALFILGRNIQTSQSKFDELGIAIKRNADGSADLTETFLNIADAFTATSDPARRAEIAFSTLGRQGRELIPLLEQGREGISRFFEGAESGRQIVTQEQIDGAFEFKLALDAVGDEVGGLARAIGSGLIPVLQPFVELLAGTVGVLNKVVDALSKVSSGVQGLIEDFADLVDVDLEGIGDNIKDFLSDVISLSPQGTSELHRLGQEAAALRADTASAAAPTAAFTSLIQQLGLAALDSEAQLSALDAAVAGVLGALDAAGAAFDARLDAFTPTFGDTFREQANKSADGARTASGAASRLADAEEQAAERISDARRAIAEAHEDAARAIADAERSLAREVEESAARIADAERDLFERRIDFRRRIADADRDELRARQDAAAAILTAEERVEQIREQIARRGFATEGDEQALTEALRNAAAVRTDAQRDIADAQTEAKRARQDAITAEADAQRDLAEASEESAERLADARRDLARAHEEAAERIIEAERRLSQAVRDGARQVAQAQQKQISGARSVAKAQEFSVKSFRASLEANIEDLGTFTDAILEIADKTQHIADKDIREAFLAELAEMGPGAADRLKKLADLSERELGELVKLFGTEIAAAKAAADLQFDKFPPNFDRKFGAMLRVSEAKLEDLIGQFEHAGAEGGELANALAEDIADIGVQLGVAAEAAGDALPPIARHLLIAANNANTAKEKARLYKRFLDELDGTKAKTELEFGVNVTTETEQALRNFHIDNLNITAREHGGPLRAGELGLVGESGRELFVPDRIGGTVFSNPDTERIIRALGGGRSQEFNITIEEVASDPEATAFAVAARLGMESTR